MVKREKEEELKSKKKNLILSLTINTNVRLIETQSSRSWRRLKKKQGGFSAVTGDALPAKT